ncbi:hypothetical protein [Phaeobacter gallaeciensis]|uniref:hypothetical protein n=1 Tax=Phaeobacter gallaeciensis TaxID=60890 RepID=UPI00237F62DE|nr:hypothetical protein [Phaeobacter gallaeciensis]MDE4189668.1 hypothetical protein [Phaeobacter gallaeciensis]MDE4198820.1 hypothetical protein [Phaeobacter gallaeciensis]MDE4202968.1 hypothetical protein [Phaeobacter gallaeciensis]MDE4207110.1 hypothetical protein [Phaeobacter gallaeciensis]MDE4215666.1 hypothetical protein [Phaeobacter gallaeciensis]
MTETTLEAYQAAVGGLSADDMTADGLPKMKPLNAALKAAGFDTITTDKRDAFGEALVETNTETPPSGEIRLTILAAPCDPLPLHVHGVGSFSLRINDPQVLPREALDALHNAGGVEYSHEEIS